MTTQTHSNIHINGEGESTVTFVSGGALVTIPGTHPNFARIVHALAEGNDPTEFIDVFKPLSQVSDRVTLHEDSGEVFYDGEPISGGVVRTIQRYVSEGREVDNLVRFLERVQTNPSRHSREQLWGWVENADLHVAEDGRIVAWKSVEVLPAEVESNFDGSTRELAPEAYRSHSSGTAWVNGEKHDGKIPYAVGDVVTIPRELVEDNPAVACSHGLHIGSYAYASSFGGSGSKIMEVAVAPEDVVSVPHDSSQQKIRCARFEVLGVQERPTPDLSHYEPEGDGWDDEEAEWASYGLAEDEVQQTFLGRLWANFRKGASDS